MCGCLITRGVGELTYDVKATPQPSSSSSSSRCRSHLPELYEKGVKVVLVDVVRNHPQSVNPADQEQ